MQKTAQKRSILNKLREMTNVSGIAAEKFFNPEFQRVMESLRAKDDNIRSIVAGEPIGDGDPGADAIGLKDLLKSSKSNLNRREYMSAIAELGRFHKKLFDIVQIIKNLGLDVDAVHHEFLFKDLGDEQKQHLHDLKTRLAHTRRMDLIKEASIMDFFYNIGTKRGRALAAWEKRYPKQIGKLKKDTVMLQARSEALLTQLISILKEMASARSIRNVDSYMKATDKINKAYQSYDKSFKDYYSANVKGFLEKVELVSPTVKVEDAKEMGKQELPTEDTRPEGSLDTPSHVPSTEPMKEPTHVSAPGTESAIPLDLTKMKAPPTEKTGPPSGMSVRPSLPYSPTIPSPGVGTIPVGPPSHMTVPPSSGGPTVPPSSGGPTLPPSASPTIVSPPPSGMAPPSHEFKSDQLAEQMWGKKSAHVNFYNTLEKMSGESPTLLAFFISKYARKVEATDPTTSIKLLQIVKRIKG